MPITPVMTALFAVCSPVSRICYSLSMINRVLNGYWLSFHFVNQQNTWCSRNQTDPPHTLKLDILQMNFAEACMDEVCGSLCWLFSEHSFRPKVVSGGWRKWVGCIVTLLWKHKKISEVEIIGSIMRQLFCKMFHVFIWRPSNVVLNFFCETKHHTLFNKWQKWIFWNKRHRHIFTLGIIPSLQSNADHVNLKPVAGKYTSSLKRNL